MKTPSSFLRFLLSCFVALSCFAILSPANAGDPPTIEEAEDRGVKGLRATFTVDHPRNEVFALLNDLDQFTRIFPNVKSLKVLKTHGNTQDVLYKVDAVLSEAEYTLRRTHQEGEKADVITWNRLSGSAKIIRGSWTLYDLPRQRTKVVYQSYVDVSAVIPTSVVRDIAIGKTEEMIERIRKACDERAQKPSRPPRP